MREFLYSILSSRAFLWLLFSVNLLGTLYGYYWYEYQLVRTEPIFLLFVPDSPTASLFFTIVIFLYIIGKRWKIMEALALVTLVKYGIWAVVMNLLTWQVTGDISWQAWMLILSHGAMALQGILYAPFYRFTWVHLILAAIWTLHNDIIDYVFMQYPIYRSLEYFIAEIGYFTFWLSIASIGLAYWLVVRKQSNKLKLSNFSS
ncbi:DUF1405 domain-containing protein [Jeotgalibacillus proteolyticus]|uniref:DUF1405 domain-containing protein n=1 Tax=Jeotgalibacillus proteolyticus TaxID=2082395 RepID=A0A2S5GDY5_9BACL|nr:DUF1405 domain-containing protein [Jeotgalibacillus proteolyticus]PPA71252.1 DUF1405 domain-containing protein [Jeotgalibacillus proteolyticus]